MNAGWSYNTMKWLVEYGMRNVDYIPGDIIVDSVCSRLCPGRCYSIGATARDMMRKEALSRHLRGSASASPATHRAVTATYQRVFDAYRFNGILRD